MTRRRSTSGTVRATPAAGGQKNGPSTWWARAFAVFLALFGLVPLSNLLSEQTPDSWYGGAALLWLILTLLTLALAFAIAAAFGPRLDHWIDSLESVVLGIDPRTFGIACAALTLLVCAASALYAFPRHWLPTDEASALWEGRLILSGRLWVPEDPNSLFFPAGSAVVQGRAYAQYPIGGPTLLALGDAAHVRWIVGPLLSGIMVLAFYRFARQAVGEGLARAVTIGIALSGSIVLMGATGMSHVPSLTLIMIALAAFPVWAESESRRSVFASAAVIGACIAGDLLFRPYDAVLAAIVIGAFQLAMIRRSRDRVASLVVQFLGGLPLLALTLAANTAITGHPFVFGYEAVYGNQHDPGFHMSPSGFEHTPLRGVMLASSYLLELNHSLLYSPIPALLLVVVGLLAMRRVTRWDLLSWSMILSFVIGYGAYWYDGRMFGPRFLYPTVPLFILLAVRAPAAIADRLAGAAARAMWLVIPLCLVYAWCLPGARFSLTTLTASLHASALHEEIDLERVTEDAGAHHAIVFVPVRWSDRQMARLLGLHIDLASAQQIHRFADACDLEHALDREMTLPGDPAARVARIVAATRAADAAPQIKDSIRGDSPRLRTTDSLPADCAAEHAGDSVRAIPFDYVLPLATYDRAGIVTGDVIFARDMGGRLNEELRSRFHDRTWYLMRRAAAPGGGILVPYPAPPTGTGISSSP